MLGHRTLISLAQFLELQGGEAVALLLSKHGLDSEDVSVHTSHRAEILGPITWSLSARGESEISDLLKEIARTSRDLRNHVKPGYRYDERFEDLERCLQLDGYSIADGELVVLDPTIVGVRPMEDDLRRELEQSGLPRAREIIKKLDDSAEAFRVQPPKHNASLNDARVAMETLAVNIAEARRLQCPGEFDPKSWGSVIAYLRNIGLFTDEQERGLAGVYGFLSPGSHRPVGLSEGEFTRLGRQFVLGMCWFLVKLHRTSP